VLKRHRRRVQSPQRSRPFPFSFLPILSRPSFPALPFLISPLAVSTFISFANICFHTGIVDRWLVIHHGEHEAVGNEMDCSTIGFWQNYDFTVDCATKSRSSLCAIKPNVILLAKRNPLTHRTSLQLSLRGTRNAIPFFKWFQRNTLECMNSLVRKYRQYPTLCSNPLHFKKFSAATTIASTPVLIVGCITGAKYAL
jgi:hypothetical protein